jgi:hypothetical protein
MRDWLQGHAVQAGTRVAGAPAPTLQQLGTSRPQLPLVRCDCSCAGLAARYGVDWDLSLLGSESELSYAVFRSGMLVTLRMHTTQAWQTCSPAVFTSSKHVDMIRLHPNVLPPQFCR